MKTILTVKARKIAHRKYDDCLFCPSCNVVLLGLHMNSSCYMSFIEKEARKIEKELKKNKMKIFSRKQQDKNSGAKGKSIIELRDFLSNKIAELINVIPREQRDGVIEELYIFANKDGVNIQVKLSLVATNEVETKLKVSKTWLWNG